MENYEKILPWKTREGSAMRRRWPTMLNSADQDEGWEKTPETLKTAVQELWAQGPGWKDSRQNGSLSWKKQIYLKWMCLFYF